jgi:hypothetical protein
MIMETVRYLADAVEGGAEGAVTVGGEEVADGPLVRQVLHTHALVRREQIPGGRSGERKGFNAVHAASVAWPCGLCIGAVGWGAGLRPLKGGSTRV